MVINEKTGLPDVPEGYFWRMDRHPFGHLRLRLMEHRRFGAREVAGGLLDPYASLSPTDLEERVIRCAGRIVDDLALAAAAEGLYGDYPPKNINEREDKNAG